MDDGSRRLMWDAAGVFAVDVGDGGGAAAAAAAE